VAEVLRRFGEEESAVMASLRGSDAGMASSKWVVSFARKSLVEFLQKIVELVSKG